MGLIEDIRANVDLWTQQADALERAGQRDRATGIRDGIARDLGHIEYLESTAATPKELVKEEIRGQYARDRTFQEAKAELIRDLEIPPDPVPATAEALAAEAKTTAALDTLSEVLYDEARLELASQIHNLSVDETIALLREEIVAAEQPVVTEPDPIPEPSFLKRIFGGA